MIKLTRTLMTGVVLVGTQLMTEVNASEPTIEAGLGYSSKYIWRGIDSGNDMLDFTTKISGTEESTGVDLMAGLWYGRMLDLAAGSAGSEVNLYADANKDLGFATAKVGYIFYHFAQTPSPLENVQEFYFGLSREFAGFETSLTYYLDIAGVNKGYTELGIEREVALTRSFSIDTSATVGFVTSEGELASILLNISKDFRVNDNMNMTPYVSYSIEMENLDELGGSEQTDEFFAGLGLTYGF